MNANINYDEIPDTSAVQEDLLAALSSQHVTVHTNEEPDFDYMENEDVAFVVKNPHNEENLLIELGGEFSVFFGLWHGQYKAVEYDYDRMKKDIAAILAGNAGVLSLYAEDHWLGSALCPEKVAADADVAKLLEAQQDAPAQYSVITQLALLTGARRGEICALRWSDIDLDAGVISINRTVQNIAGRGTVFTAPPRQSAPGGASR